jgi:transcriptional regulator with XRE-family HTH domain
MEDQVPQRIQMLRKRCGLSIRQLAALAGVTPGIISCIERGKNSPSIATLQKILAALGTDLAAFFTGDVQGPEGPVFAREHMRTISDGDRTYTIVFSKRRGIRIELFDEHYRRSRQRPPFETLRCDVAGYVISGALTLEIEGQPKRTVRPGDAFYIPRGQVHRGYNAGDEPARLITAYHPAKY